MTSTDTKQPVQAIPADIVEAANKGYLGFLEAVEGHDTLMMTAGEYKAIAVEAFAKAILAERERFVSSMASRIVLEQSWGSNPEQYDATLDGARVGYLRLRHGRFRVDYPEVGDTTVLEGEPKGEGSFERDERDEWLFKAKVALARAILGVALPASPKAGEA